MRNVANPSHHAGLEEVKAKMESELRERYADYDRAQLKGLPVLEAYRAYYSQFRKTYHVQLQLESVVFKGKSIPQVAALVEAMFIAELKNLLLTAGHDLDVVQSPVSIEVADGNESYVRLNGKEQTTKAGDMMIVDREGILSSIIYGPDQRTRIRPETKRVLFTVYGPRGVARGVMEGHLEDIKGYVELVAPLAEVELLEIFGTE